MEMYVYFANVVFLSNLTMSSMNRMMLPNLFIILMLPFVLSSKIQFSSGVTPIALELLESNSGINEANIEEGSVWTPD